MVKVAILHCQDGSQSSIVGGQSEHRKDVPMFTMRSGTSEISKLQLSLEAPDPYYMEILFQKIPTEIFKQQFSV